MGWSRRKLKLMGIKKNAITPEEDSYCACKHERGRRNNTSFMTTDVYACSL